MAKKIILDPKLEKKIIADYMENGSTQKELSAKYGLSVWLIGKTIRNYLNSQIYESDSVQDDIPDYFSESETFVTPVLEERKKPIALGSNVSQQTEDLYQALCALDSGSLKKLYVTTTTQLMEKEKEIAGLKALAAILESLVSEDLIPHA